MRIQPQKQAPVLHLTYCLNVHPGESWQECLSAIRDCALRVRDEVCPAGAPFGLGLRLGMQAAQELSCPQTLQEFQNFLTRENLYVFTINGFPYGQFHQTQVKENVYAPDWRCRERVQYTNLLADILAALLGDDVEGSISTVPGSYKPWITSEEDIKTICENLADVAVHLYQLRQKTGKRICIALEPEPDCLLETTDEVSRFFVDSLSKYALGKVCETLGVSQQTAAEILYWHVGVCLDTAHVAVEFEDPAEVLKILSQLQIRVAKIQLSSALHVVHPDQAALVLREFCDEVYLHQVKTHKDQSLAHYADLPQALESHTPADHWRVHFHVPLFFEQMGNLSGTSHLLPGEFSQQILRGVCRHLEIETYTFNVLPDSLRPTDLPHAITKEYHWVLQHLLKAPSPHLHA